MVVALTAPAAGVEPRRGRTEGAFSVAGGVHVENPRRRTDYVVLRQLDHFLTDDISVGFAVGLAGPIDAVPGSALQLQSAYNLGSGAVVPYLGVHVGVLADIAGADFMGTAGALLGLRWHVDERWSLFTEAKHYATYPRLGDSLVAFVLGFSIAARRE